MTFVSNQNRVLVETSISVESAISIADNVARIRQQNARRCRNAGAVRSWDGTRPKRVDAVEALEARDPRAGKGRARAAWIGDA